LNQFLTRIYRTTGISLLLTLASAYATVAIPGLAEAAEIFVIGGGAISFMAFLKAQQIAPKVYQ
jgi:FtsH-binding integral membrane protein